MKVFLLSILLTRAACFTGFAQEEVVSMPENALYILDSATAARQKAVFPMDENDCYIQIYDGYAVVSYRFRGKQVFYSGTIHSPEIVEVEGEKVTKFAIHTDNRYSTLQAGQRLFIGIPEGNTSSVYELNAKGGLYTIFRSHPATKEEIQALQKRSEEQTGN